MELKDAFKVSDLMKSLEKEGLPMAEEAAELVARAALNWAKNGLTKMGGMYAVIGLPGIAMLEPAIKGELDKIDGQPG